MKTFKLKTQFSFLIIITMVGLLTIGISAYWGLTKLKINGPLYNRIVQNKDLIADILPPPEYILETHLVVYQLRFAQNADQTDDLIKRLDSLHSDFKSRHDFWMNANLDKSLQKSFFVDAYENGEYYYEILNAEFIPAAKANDAKQMDQVLPKLVEIYQEHLKGINDTVLIASALGSKEEKNAAKLDNTITTTMVSIFLVASLGIFLLSLAIIRRLFSQLGGEPSVLNVVTQRIASGDLSSTLPVAANDTTSLLAALDGMQTNLRGLISQIKTSADSIGTGAKEIAAGNSDLSSRTEEQASSLEETASSMEQLSSTVKQNAENAKQANQLAAAASGVAVKGGQVVGEVVGTMSAINESSRKIVDIISVIDGIAFQTNILALNAAVEAARAGEQGRGFAVVAAEVRNLAQRSAAAAKEIKQLIGNSVDKVEGGTKLVAQAGETMEEIVNSVKRVTDIMGEIAAASAEQSSGIDQINNAVTQMDEVTQQNAALVEQAAAAAESLEEQAQELAESVSVFKLETASTASVARRPTARMAAPSPAPKAETTPAKAVTETKPKLPKAKAAAEEEWEEF